jgi:hypothetical protein
MLLHMPLQVMPGRALLHRIEDRDGARRLRLVHCLRVPVAGSGSLFLSVGVFFPAGGPTRRKTGGATVGRLRVGVRT